MRTNPQEGSLVMEMAASKDGFVEMTLTQGPYRLLVPQTDTDGPFLGLVDGTSLPHQETGMTDHSLTLRIEFGEGSGTIEVVGTLASVHLYVDGRDGPDRSHGSGRLGPVPGRPTMSIGSYSGLLGETVTSKASLTWLPSVSRGRHRDRGSSRVYWDHRQRRLVGRHPHGRYGMVGGYGHYNQTVSVVEHVRQG